MLQIKFIVCTKLIKTLCILQRVFINFGKRAAFSHEMKQNQQQLKGDIQYLKIVHVVAADHQPVYSRCRFPLLFSVLYQERLVHN